METIDEFCVKCGRKMFVAKVGQEVVELTEKGIPYKLISGDILECPVCHCQVVTRFGKVTPRHDGEFIGKLALAKSRSFDDPSCLLEVV